MLAFDIDGIIINSVDGMLNKFNELNGTNLELSDWKCYDFEKTFNYPREKIVEAFRLYIEESENSPVFYSGAIETLQLINETIDPLVLITNRGPKWALIAKKQIEGALGKEVQLHYKFDSPLSERKSKLETLKSLGVRIYLEDDHTWWLDYLTNGISIYTFPRVYNEQYTLTEEMIRFRFSEPRFRLFCDWYHFQEEFNQGFINYTQTGESLINE